MRVWHRSRDRAATTGSQGCDEVAISGCGTVYHWSLGSIQYDPRSHEHYAALRKEGALTRTCVARCGRSASGRPHGHAQGRDQLRSDLTFGSDFFVENRAELRHYLRNGNLRTGLSADVRADSAQEMEGHGIDLPACVGYCILREPTKSSSSFSWFAVP